MALRLVLVQENGASETYRRHDLAITKQDARQAMHNRDGCRADIFEGERLLWSINDRGVTYEPKAEA